jgi:protein-disulfide isomerase
MGGLVRAAAQLACLVALAACVPPLPKGVEAELAHTPKGQFTVIEFVDFQCPFCRQNHVVLEPLLASYGPRVRVIYKHIPLHSHVYAEGAARTAICAEAQGKGREMADALYATPVRQLSEEGLAALGEKLSLDAAALTTCRAAPETDARLRRDRDAFIEAQHSGVPATWVGRHPVEGVLEEDTLRALLTRASAEN